MPRLSQPRQGQILTIKGKPISFSFWPAQRTSARFGLQTSVFSSNPFALVSSVIQTRGAETIVDEALSYCHQAQYMFDASGNAREPAAKPLLLYYSLLNLAKGFCLFRQGRPYTGRMFHGLADKLRSGGREISDAYLQAHESDAAKSTFNAFDELLKAYGTSLPASPHGYDVSRMLPQIVTGHRMWSIGAARRERFVGIEKIEYWEDPGQQAIWIRFYVFADTLKRLDYSHKQLLQRAQLQGDYCQVECGESLDGRKLSCLEQLSPVRYSHRAADEIQSLTSGFRNRLWAIASSVPPFRRYYVYLCPPSEQSAIVPQLASIFAVSFYLGMITRYRPHHFDSTLRGEFGPFVQDFLGWAGKQFLYLIASEFAERDVTRAAVV